MIIGLLLVESQFCVHRAASTVFSLHLQLVTITFAVIDATVFIVGLLLV